MIKQTALSKGIEHRVPNKVLFFYYTSIHPDFHIPEVNEDKHTLKFQFIFNKCIEMLGWPNKIHENYIYVCMIC